MAIPELVAWGLLALLAALSMRAYRPMPLVDDSYQYLNVAANLKRGLGLTTSLVHFDAERSHGRIPAPLTTFPPGYPLAIAAAGFDRGPASGLEATARLVSCVCYAGTAAFLAWALALAGVTLLPRLAMMCLFLTNAVALSFATSVLTEPLFMLLSTASLATLIWVENAVESGFPARRVAPRAALAYLLAGLAYWVRYAGLFLIVALLAHALLRRLLEKSRLRTLLLSVASIPVALAAVLMLRNVMLVGTWKGGNELAVRNSLKTVAADYVRAQVHLLLGAHAVTFGVWEGLLLCGVLSLAILALAVVRKVPAHPSAAALLTGICVIVYSAGIFYAGVRTVISFGTRMFLPALPLYLLLLGMALTWLASRWAAGARLSWLLPASLLAATAGYAGANGRDFYEQREPAPHQILAPLYAAPAAGGEPLANWVESNIGPDSVIAATAGQATGYLLHRPTLSMVGAEYSAIRWECAEVKKQMQRFGASYLILYRPPAPPSAEFLWTQSQFIAAAASHQPPPCGFVVAAESAAVRILKIGAAEPALNRR